MSIKVEHWDHFSGHRGPVYALAQGMQPHLFYSSGSDGWVVEWNLQNPDLGTALAQTEGSVYALRLDAQEGLLWVGKNERGLHAIDVHQKVPKHFLPLPDQWMYDVLAWQGKIWTAQPNGLIQIFDYKGLKPLKSWSCTNKNTRRLLALSPELVAAAYSDGWIRIWDAMGHCHWQWKAHDDSVFAMIYDMERRVLITGGKDARIKKWELNTSFKPFAQTEVVGHIYAVKDLAWHPNKHWFASASMDKTVKIWDLENMQLLKVLDASRHQGHRNSVNALHWTEFESMLVSASDDKLLSVWKFP